MENSLDFESVYMQAGASEMRGGKRIFYDNAVKFLANNNNDRNDSNTKTVIEGIAIEGERSLLPTIIFDEQGFLYEYKCNCFAMKNPSSNPCCHIVALALSYEEKFPQFQKEKPKQSKAPITDVVAHELSLSYEKKRFVTSSYTGDNKASFTATLVLDSGKVIPKVRFTISQKRRYQIKNIADFLISKKNMSSIRFGADLELIIDSTNFDEQSAKVLNFLETSVLEKELINKDFLLTENDTLNVNKYNHFVDCLSLLPTQLDELFLVYGGKLIEVESNYKKAGLRVVEANVDTLKCTVLVQSGDGGYYVSTDFGFGKHLVGKAYDYLITSLHIYKLSKKFVDTAFELLKAIALAGRLFILEQDMPLFYNNCLVAVEDKVNIVSNDIDLSIHKAPSLNATLRLEPSEYTTGLVANIVANYNGEYLDFIDGEFIGDMVRDKAVERQLLEFLKRYFPRFPQLNLDKDREIFRFLKRGTKRLSVLCKIELSDEVANIISIKTAPKCKVGVSLSSGVINLGITASGYSEKDLVAILNAYKLKEGFVRLEDGTFVDLSSAQMGAIADFFSFVDKPLKTDTALPTAFAPFIESIFDSEDFELEIKEDFTNLLAELKNPVKMEIPKEVEGVLRDYQIEGFRWLSNLARHNAGGILADDMGLGKSLQIISLFLGTRSRGKNSEIGKKIIVCPTSLILNWVAEFNKFASNIKVCAVLGTQKERKSIINSALKNSEYEVVITSYELLRRDIELYSDYEFEFAVLDEAQYIKNPTTQNANTVKKLNAIHRFALSGTPIENSLAELWSIFDFIMPKYLYSYNRFRDEFERAIVSGDKSTLESFNALVSPFILRRLKHEVLTQLPPKIEQELLVVADSEQQKLYDANLLDVRQKLNFGKEKNRVEVLALLMRLRQIACHPKLVYPEFDKEVAKFEAVIEKINLCIAGGHKILLFSSFLGVMELFKERFNKLGISHFILRGDTPKSERMRLVEAFNNDDTNVFLISLKAGGTGLNLTGADVVIHYDPWWSEAATQQASDRAHRIGQEKTVQVFKAITLGTVEEGMVALAKKKSALSQLVLGAGVEKLSTDELIGVLKG
ncbi:MAG: SNF2-related protein [Firmicutes bacterium]|nr:SNF2-related protein [Bacillota bacterium]